MKKQAIRALFAGITLLSMFSATLLSPVMTAQAQTTGTGVSYGTRGSQTGILVTYNNPGTYIRVEVRNQQGDLVKSNVMFPTPGQAVRTDIITGVPSGQYVVTVSSFPSGTHVLTGTVTVP